MKTENRRYNLCKGVDIYALLAFYGNEGTNVQQTLVPINCTNNADVRFDKVGQAKYSETDRKCKVCHKNLKFICIKTGIHRKFCFICYHAK